MDITIITIIFITLVLIIIAIAYANITKLHDENTQREERKGKHMNKRIIIIVSSIVALLAVAIICANTVFYYSDEGVTVSHDGYCGPIDINVECKVIYHMPTAPKFVTDKTLEEIKTIAEQSCDKAYIDEESDILYIVANNNIVSVERYDEGAFLWQKRNFYRASINDISVGSSFTVPFPVELLDGEYSGEDAEFKVKGSFEELKEFYLNLNGVEIEENKIKIDRGTEKYLLRYKDNKVTIKEINESIKYGEYYSETTTAMFWLDEFQTLHYLGSIFMSSSKDYDYSVDGNKLVASNDFETMTFEIVDERTLKLGEDTFCYNEKQNIE